MNATGHHESPDRLVALAQSPWFWLTIFSAVGLLFLVAMGPKYGRRQSQLERQYQARGQVHRDVAEGRPLGELATDEAIEYSTPQNTLITLTPLKIAIGIVFVVSAGMLIRRALIRSQDSSNTNVPFEDT